MAKAVDNVSVELSVVLGRSMMPIHQRLKIGGGAVIELDTTVDDAAMIYANERLIAPGRSHGDRRSRRHHDHRNGGGVRGIGAARALGPTVSMRYSLNALQAGRPCGEGQDLLFGRTISAVVAELVDAQR